ncbi:hypothetical protein U0070_017219, partial [Myodes glareolus]
DLLSVLESETFWEGRLTSHWISLLQASKYQVLLLSEAAEAPLSEARWADKSRSTSEFFTECWEHINLFSNNFQVEKNKDALCITLTQSSPDKTVASGSEKQDLSFHFILFRDDTRFYEADLFQGRFSVRHSKVYRTFHLVISPVRPEDSGTYYCASDTTVMQGLPASLLLWFESVADGARGIARVAEEPQCPYLSDTNKAAALLGWADRAEPHTEGAAVLTEQKPGPTPPDRPLRPGQEAVHNAKSEVIYAGLTLPASLFLQFSHLSSFKLDTHRENVH